MRGNRKKEKRDATTYGHTKFTRKWLLIGGVAVASIGTVFLAAAYTGLFLSGTQSEARAQSASLGQVLNSITPVEVQATVAQEKLTSVAGQPLAEVAKSTKSETTVNNDGIIKSVFKEGQAEVAILTAGSNLATGDNTIAFSITNTGTESFKIVSFGIEGETKSGFIPMQVLAVSEKNTETPNVNFRDAVALDPGESMTAYIVGKWRAVEISEDISEFRAGAVYRYEAGDAVEVWSISTDLYNLS